jgi:FK506-binding protein 2
LALVFETELLGIQGVESPASIVEKTASSTATEGAEAAAETETEAAEATDDVVADTDGDAQEHNEL